MQKTKWPHTIKLAARKPLVFLMQGVGVGYSPLFPGTAGTLLAIPLFWLLGSTLSLPYYLGVVFLFLLLGVYGCEIAGKDLKTPDHSSLVWDEIVGFLIAMTSITPHFFSIVLGFLLFRFFDILKPWPICFVDKKIKNGWGVMLDDVLAGMVTNLILQLVF